MEVPVSFTLFPSGNPSTPWDPGERMVHGRMTETRNRVTRWSLGICPEGISVPDTEAVIGDQLPTRRKLQSSVFRYANNYVWTNNRDSQMLDCKFPGVFAQSSKHIQTFLELFKEVFASILTMNQSS